MGRLYEYICPNCFYRLDAPANKTGRYSTRITGIQLLSPVKKGGIFHLAIPSRAFIEKGEDDPTNEAANQYVADFLKYGVGSDDLPPIEERENYELKEIEPRFTIWADIPGHRRCPMCHKRNMVRISKFPKIVD